MPGPPIHVSYATEWRLWFFSFIFFLLRFATYLGTLTLCPHLPSCNARLERQTGLPISRLLQETAPPPPPPALGPGALLAAQWVGPPSMPSTSTAAFRREHPAVSESWRQRTVSGVERGWKPQNGQEWGEGINKTALHQMTNVIFVGSLLPAGQARDTLLVYRSA